MRLVLVKVLFVVCVVPIDPYRVLAGAAPGSIIQTPQQTRPPVQAPGVQKPPLSPQNSSNTGPSQIIDPYGRVVASALRIFSEDVVAGEVKLGTAGTVYTSIGDLFVFIVIAGFALGVLWRFLNDRSNVVQGLEPTGKTF